MLLAWMVALAAEHVFVGIAWRDEILGAWELWPARTAAAPVFIGAALGLAFLCVGLHRLAKRSSPRGIHAIGALCGVAVGWGVGTGRHFEHAVYGVPLLRVALALAVGALALATEHAYFAARRRVAMWLPAILVVIAFVSWWADGHVLVRLYPAFHMGLFAMSLLALGFAVLETDRTKVAGVGVGWVGVALGLLCIAYAPIGAKRLRTYDNLRRLLVEHAPWMGRAVRIAAVISPPDALIAATDIKGPSEVARALDWSGLDVVLVSIDALRADHVGAYGYSRPTTPHIDALAREGTLFRHAYCPTPHTSYSVTSMMTGKYMRPLLALGLGQDSATMATELRRYGYRTAAFYPPAVFFIDEPRFTSFEERGLDFEYRKVEFADPTLREAQLREYLATAPHDRPLLLWVHFFEPHEPYVQHPGHHFGETDVDAYDSEIAAADDGVGRVVAAVREGRPNAVVILTADHGEEFGDHGGRYHGTTVYEEQVRVPLIVVGRGVRAATVDAPVQTIDLVPTLLSALGIPRPPRVRGRDLGAALSHEANEVGFAFAETDDFSLLAKGPLRLVCEKQADACALFDVSADPGEKHDVSRDRQTEVTTMRAEIVAMERSHGRFEGQGSSLPEALRRGAAGDVAAAEEIAGLLDDVNPTYRREAARVLFDLRSPRVRDQLARAASKDDDDEVRGTCSTTLVRIDKAAPTAPVRPLLGSANVEVRRRAALVLAERDDAAGVSELTAWLASAPANLDFVRQREIIDALARVKARSAVPTLVALLDDVRLRAAAARALGAVGDKSAKNALYTHFVTEAYVPVRPYEADALVALGAGKEMFAPLARFAGLPEPMNGAIDVAAHLGLLDAAHSGLATHDHEIRTTLHAPAAGPLRLGVLVEVSNPGTKPGAVTLEVDGSAQPTAMSYDEAWADVGTHGDLVAVHASADSNILGVWLVPKTTEASP